MLEGEKGVEGAREGGSATIGGTKIKINKAGDEIFHPLYVMATFTNNAQLEFGRDNKNVRGREGKEGRENIGE